MRIPTATYRLQLNAGFTLAQVRELLDYLKALRISDLYLSPINTAPPESNHNYDQWSFEEINPTIGGQSAFDELAIAAKERGLGLLVDIVPNHMGITGQGNKWWRDVLKRGPRSEFANIFDIRWEEEDGVPRVRLPVLGDFCENILKKGELKIEGDELVYYGARFPIADGTLVANDVRATLAGQFYRLMHWRYGTEQINYRRFFEVNGLLGVSVEKREVFDRTHAMILKLVDAGKVTGLRIDHIDGLAEPGEYLRRLAENREVYVLVEKILGPHERLPQAWPVAGTSGYDAMRSFGALWIDRSNEQKLTQLYQEITGETRSFDEIAVASKREVLRNLFPGEFSRLIQSAHAIARKTPAYYELSPRAIEGAIEALLAWLHAYRTYAEGDCAAVDFAADHARKGVKAYYHPAIDFIVELWKTGREPEFKTRLQQLTGPVVAKGVEDTAYYRYNRLIALNEVGGEPQRFGATIDEFHKDCQWRAAHQPHSMLATSTHDTKFSEDVRCRMAVLSEIPDEWAKQVRIWIDRNARFKTRVGGKLAPDRNEEYRLLQTLVGCWPISIERLLAFMQKSTRESKMNTSWQEPNAAWDKACENYCRGLLGSDEFTRSLQNFIEERIAPLAATNSLAQTVLKMTAPGVPDFYQGNEIWDYSLVDPDNRRPVDYKLRQELLRQIDRKSPRSLFDDYEIGAVKMKVIRDTLQLRSANAELFQRGAYEPLVVTGKHSQRVLAFTRTHEKRRVVVAVPVCAGAVASPPLGPNWGDTALAVRGNFENIFTGYKVATAPPQLAEIFGDLPVAILREVEG